MTRVNLVLAGEAGQGINTAEELILKCAIRSGLHVYATKEYMSRVRGGVNSSTILISGGEDRYFQSAADLVLPMSPAALASCLPRITPETMLLLSGELEFSGQSSAILRYRKDDLLRGLSKPIYLNSALAGMLGAILGLERDGMEQELREQFAKLDHPEIAANLTALENGYELGKGLRKEALFQPGGRGSRRIVISGSQAVGLGALSGGIRFLPFYPMSPATAVTSFLTSFARREVAVLQLEDEIACANAALGCWYAGGRAMLSTSGGGFALMCEALSLSGMSETPLVVHLAQRPGPATGLATRTAQQDLELALYAGHGEFPRLIFAPADLEDCIALTRMAFDMADRFQVPAFILTDQFLLDSYYDTGPLPAQSPLQKHTVAAAAGYRRYEVTSNGISPRAVPGSGPGIVMANGNEHDDYGDTTEESTVTEQQQRKRQDKLRLLQQEALPPELHGPESCEDLIVCWGSPWLALRRAFQVLELKRSAILLIRQPYPLHPATAALLRGARRIFCLEQNLSGQLAKLLAREYSLPLPELIGKMDGRAFTVEELVSRIKKLQLR